MHCINMKMPYDLYGRNARRINQAINDLDCDVWIEKESIGRRCNANTLIGILSLGIEKNDDVLILTDSNNYKVVFDEVTHIINNE